jgi:hypothetical protein
MGVPSWTHTSLAAAVLCAALGTGACSPQALGTPREGPPPAAARPPIAAADTALSPEALWEEVRVLAAPEMEGRAAGTPGADRAAARIAEAFRRAGLQPGGDAGTFLQRFEILTGIHMGPDNAFTLRVRGAPPRAFGPGTDFTPFSFSEEGRVEGEVVFAGYGITAPELGYDDYAGLDVEGKVVLLLTHEPRERDPAGPFRRPEAYRYTELRYKTINAREHGAAAVILVTDPLGHPGEPEALVGVRGLPSRGGGILALHARRSLAEAALAPAGLDLAAVQRQIDAALKPRSLPLPGVRAEARVSLVRAHGMTANVVGILPGTDPRLRDQAIVVGAHYDHLGLGGETSMAPAQVGTVHPGADDNASGTAGVLALARTFAAAGGTRRTLVFAAFGAEEMGLLGSTTYAAHPPVPLDRTVAMLNFDMIGRLREGKVYVSGVDTGEGLEGILRGANAEVGLSLILRGDGYDPSDHTAFLARERPVLFFFTGAHGDYHRPSDTVDKINAAGMRQVLLLARRVVGDLANREAVVAFRKPAAAPPRSAGSRGEGYGPYFGAIPDFGAAGPPGVLLGGVRAGSPADRAGLRSGDIVVRFAGVTVRALQDLVFALRSQRAGDEVEVTFLRDGAAQTVRAVLEPRR